MAVDESCPVCLYGRIVCGKWTLLLSATWPRALAASASSSARWTGISPRTLSLRLRALEEEGIVERHSYPEVPPRVEYALTEKGRDLLPLVEDMRRYGRAGSVATAVRTAELSELAAAV